MAGLKAGRHSILTSCVYNTHDRGVPMSNKIEERKAFVINVLYFSFAAVLLYCSIKYVLGWILPFIIGFFVALLLKPLIRFVSLKCRLPHKLATVILALLFYATVGILLIWIGAKIVYLIRDAFTSLPDVYTQYIEPLINSTLEKIKNLTARLDPNMVHIIQNMTASFSDSAGTVITNISSQVIKYLSSTVISLPSFLLAVLLSVISSIFFAMDFSRIAEYVMYLLPEKIQAYLTQLKKIVINIGLKYVKSYAILLSITFVELSVGLSIFGVENAVAVAALIALIDLLPLIGVGGVLIPWVIILLIMRNITLATELAVLYIIMVIVRNILEPKIVGQQIGIHPLAMLISMYVGLQIFGFIGIFVLPILLVIGKGFYDNKKPTLKSRGFYEQ